MIETIDDDRARELARHWVEQTGRAPPTPKLAKWARDSLSHRSILLTGHILGIGYAQAQALAGAVAS